MIPDKKDTDWSKLGNNRYKIFQKKEKDNKEDLKQSIHEFYYTEGEYKFGELNLMRYDWERTFPVFDEGGTIVAMVKKNKDGEGVSEPVKEKDYLKTLIYEDKSKNVMAVMYLNLKSRYHELDIILREQNNPELIKKTKSMLERELKCVWHKRVIKIKPVAELIDDVGEN